MFPFDINDDHKFNSLRDRPDSLAICILGSHYREDCAKGLKQYFLLHTLQIKISASDMPFELMHILAV